MRKSSNYVEACFRVSVLSLANISKAQDYFIGRNMDKIFLEQIIVRYLISYKSNKNKNV